MAILTSSTRNGGGSSWLRAVQGRCSRPVLIGVLLVLLLVTEYTDWRPLAADRDDQGDVRGSAREGIHGERKLSQLDGLNTITPLGRLVGSPNVHGDPWSGVQLHLPRGVVLTPVDVTAWVYSGDSVSHVAPQLLRELRSDASRFAVVVEVGDKVAQFGGVTGPFASQYFHDNVWSFFPHQDQCPARVQQCVATFDGASTPESSHPPFALVENRTLRVRLNSATAVLDVVNWLVKAVAVSSSFAGAARPCRELRWGLTAPPPKRHPCASMSPV